MSSVSSKRAAIKPQQPRSERTLAAILDASTQLFLDMGFEATTMTEIATRAGMSIGGLYHYFPDKRAVVLALLTRYAAELEQAWEPLMQRIPDLSHTEFASLFIETVTKFVQHRPAYLALTNTFVRLRRNSSARQALRNSIAQAFRAKSPQLGEAEALLAANITLQLARGMTTTFHDTPGSSRDAIVATYKDLLTYYLGRVLR